jgi:MFS family permease
MSPALTDRRRRQALTLLIVINLFNYIDRYVLAAVLTRIGAEMLSGDPKLNTKEGLLSTVFLISYMVLSPVFGILGDRFARWKLIGVGVLLWSLASGASGVAGNYWLLLFTRALVGVGEAAYGPVAPTLIADLYPVEQRGKVMSWFYMAIPVGSALGYTLGGVADAFLDWRWAFYLVVPPGLLLGVLCFFLPEPSREMRSAHHARWSDYAELLRTPSYLWNTFAMTALTFAIGGIAFWMPKYIAEFRGAGSLAKVNLTFGIITVITGISATLLGGITGDALRTRIRGAYFFISAIALALAFPMLLLILYMPFPVAWIFIFLAEFCLFFNTGPSNTALANVARPHVRATAFALNIFVIHALGDAISPPIIGWLADLTHSDLHPKGNLDVGFVVVGALMLLGSAAWFVGSKTLDRDTARASTPLDEA